MVGRSPTPKLIAFCKVHQIDLDWMLEGGMGCLRQMLRRLPRKPEASESLIQKLEHLVPKRAPSSPSGLKRYWSTSYEAPARIAPGAQPAKAVDASPTSWVLVPHL